MPREAVWRGMTREQLDAAYNNLDAVKNSAAKLAEWAARSEAVRAARGELLDLPYGPRPRNRIDIFRCGTGGVPLLVFVHGGYWQRNNKEMFACIAEGPLARGLDVALIGYTLAPQVKLTEIVGEVCAALRWLRRAGPRFGIAARKLVLCGWSAGGHLTAMALGEADAGLSISGIFDLEPCRLSYLNAALGLTVDEQIALSPIRHVSPGSGPLALAFGTSELPELQRQSCAYGAAREAVGLPTEMLPLTGHDHFSILDELADPAGRLSEVVARLAMAAAPA
jgi:arylformamidase